ncbi:uncharacterized protein LOC129725846 [Wyeomyia smithii]|uniref:uncharacterized protein LOC129725846 n=1 Tax=Wyeomyia smithii TaxID=174621 RepID=UPI002468058F|nr:uncharacterized protein LOC129725846 [Wyeomyia smithii]
MAKFKKVGSRKTVGRKANAANMLFLEQTVSNVKKTSKKPTSERKIYGKDHAMKKMPVSEKCQAKKSALRKRRPSNVSNQYPSDFGETIETITAVEAEQPQIIEIYNNETPFEDNTAVEFTANAKITELLSKVAKLEEANDKLQKLNMKLQEALLENPTEGSFKELPGYPDKAWLLKVSQAANESDYMFVKELMLRLWPNGIGNATVSGRKSNNPSGKRKLPNQQESLLTVSPAKLDPEKVEYIKDRLFERRMLLRDAPGTAQKMAQKVPKYIAIAVANNPALRKESF